MLDSKKVSSFAKKTLILVESKEEFQDIVHELEESQLSENV